MKSSTLLVLTVSVGILLMPVAVCAETGLQQAVPPPVAQPLVREGAFAVRLADALHVGTVSNEAKAESALSAVGIAPKNGWIADYPVTPDIIGELQNAVMAAADSKEITMGRDDALEAFNNVVTASDLSVAPTDQSVEEANAAEENGAYSPDSTIINNYYYDEGPPVVTYYAPPPDYAYLYTWVPYPFWWSDFWFPGFFVLSDFDITVHGHRHFYHGKDFDHHRDFRHDRKGEHVTNHFRNPESGEMGRINAANRVHGGSLTSRRSGWSSSRARNGARAILKQSVGRANVRHGWSGLRGTSAAPYMSDRSRRNGLSRTFRSPVYHSWKAPSYSSHRTFSSARPSYSSRTYTRPSGGSRSYSSHRGSSYNGWGSTHTFQPRAGSRSSYGGWHGSSGMGGVRSFGGWHSGGGSHSFGGWHGGSFGRRR
jgi:hypothetical protein